MNMLLWVLQVLAALLYGASGGMKVFMFDKISEDVRSFDALPRKAWMALGILELVCTVGLIVPAAFHWQPALTVVAATVLAIESLVLPTSKFCVSRADLFRANSKRLGPLRVVLACWRGGRPSGR